MINENIRQIVTTQLSGVEAALNSVRSLIALPEN